MMEALSESFGCADVWAWTTIPFGPINYLSFDDGQIAAYWGWNYAGAIYLGTGAECVPASNVNCYVWSFAAVYFLWDKCTRALHGLATIRVNYAQYLSNIGRSCMQTLL